tara:strand:- start:10797 stop:11927 length:1131 start_codon:yes stop_codon:yes gene_type:complete
MNQITARIEVFRPGTFKPMAGAPITYSVADLRAIADAYDPDTAPAPIVVGHPDLDAPAFGWVEGFDFDETSDRLYANLNDIEPAFAELVKAGRFKKVSMSFFAPEQSHNPVPGTWYPKHVGFLGAAAPAVSGLKNAHFAGKGDVTFTADFGELGFEETASLFRSMRDFLIEKFGLEEANRALPSWNIEWLDEIEVEKPGRDGLPNYAAPGARQIPPPKPNEVPAVPKPNDAAFAARDAELTTREQAIKDREAKITHDDNVAFAEKLVTDGRLLPATRDKVVSVLDALPCEASVSFSEGGEKVSPAAALREILEAQPVAVSFGALPLPAGPGGQVAVAFAADGHAVDPAQLGLHQKAQDYQRLHPGTEYLAAVRAVS